MGPDLMRASRLWVRFAEGMLAKALEDANWVMAGFPRSDPTLAWATTVRCRRSPSGCRGSSTVSSVQEGSPCTSAWQNLRLCAL